MNTPLLKLGYWNTAGKQKPRLPNLIKFCAVRGWSASDWDLRSPETNLHNHNLVGELCVTKWHNDGEVSDASDKEPLYLIFWANLTPTEIQLPNGSIYIPEKCEVIVVNNNVCRHKMPDKLARGRWFTRGWKAQWKETI